MKNAEFFSGRSRLDGIDFMRTLALIIMIIANSGPYLLNTPHPVWLREISSLAAPLFIFLSGFSFSISYGRNRDLRRKFLQALYLLISAVLLDICVWNILPFQTFDVLYLIAFSLFINILIYNLSWSIKLGIALATIALSFLLRKYFGYEFLNPDPILSEINWAKLGISDIFQLKRFLIDGWFPLFPWLSFSIIGGLVAEKTQIILAHIKKWGVAGFMIFAACSAILFQQGISQGERDGYLEFFYPPTVLYLLIAFSFVFFIFSLSINLSSNNFPLLNLFNLPGRNSLFTYLIHACIISYILDSFFVPSSGLIFTLLIISFIAICYLIVYLAEWLSRKGAFKKFPEAIRSILGLR